jgi:rhamnosyltransferase
MTSVAVVVRCLNEERHIGRLLAGLERQTRVPDEIVVVDSGSTDATRDIARPRVTKIVDIEPSRFSFGRALNVGVEAASADVCVFVSAHVYPLYDTYLEHLLAPFADPEVALTYGRQVGDSRTKYSESRLLLQWFPATSMRRQTHPFCNNANAAIRRDVWQLLPYDEDLTGLEDLDWARRAQEKGCVISYVAEAPVVHVHEESWRTVANRYRREAIAYKRIMDGRKHLSAVEATGLALGNTVVDFVHAARDGVLTRNLGSIPMFRFAQFYGAWRGSNQNDAVSDALKRRFYYPLDPARPEVPDVPGRLIDYADEGNAR